MYVYLGVGGVVEEEAPLRDVQEGLDQPSKRFRKSSNSVTAVVG
jgi:hypothetical protein